MDPEKIGKFIYELRKEQNLSQYQLADLIPISRQGVSKWERGKTTPDTQTLIRLSELFNVSINELLKGERLSENKIEDLEETTLSILDQSNKKTKTIKRITTVSITIIAILLLLFLSYYFINSYNSIEVYTIGGKSNNFITRTGIFMTTREKYYLRLGKIEYVGDKQIESIKLYYKFKNKKKVIVKDNNIDDITIEEYYGYKEKISKSEINNIKNNLYIEITYNDNQKDIIKLKSRRDYNNSSLFFLNRKTGKVEKQIDKQEEKQDEVKEETKEEVKEEVKPVVQETHEEIQPVNKEIKQPEEPKQEESKPQEPEQPQEIEITPDMVINKIKEVCPETNNTYSCKFDDGKVLIMYYSLMNKITLYKDNSLTGHYFVSNGNYLCMVDDCETVFNENFKQYLFS